MRKKTCLRCKTCNKVLELGNYSSNNREYWCKPHFKQLFATKGKKKKTRNLSSHWSVIYIGNYDESFGQESVKSKWGAAPVTTDGMFPTVIWKKKKLRLFSSPDLYQLQNLLYQWLKHKKRRKLKRRKPQQKQVQKYAFFGSSDLNNKTKLAAKFQRYREEGDSNKCFACDKAVYMTERLVVEEKNVKKLFHKSCFKCTTCSIFLDLRNYGSVGGWDQNENLVLLQNMLTWNFFFFFTKFQKEKFIANHT